MGTCVASSLNVVICNVWPEWQALHLLEYTETLNWWIPLN